MCFHFDPYVLIRFNVVLMFLTMFHFDHYHHFTYEFDDMGYRLTKKKKRKKEEGLITSLVINLCPLCQFGFQHFIFVSIWSLSLSDE